VTKDFTQTDVSNTTAPIDRTWLLVPAISFGGILVSQISPLLSLAGTVGCVLASFLLAFLAFRKPKRDIVSLLTPLYAVLIFYSPGDMMYLLLIQLLYAASITVLVIRLNARFSQKDEPKHRFTEQEDFGDEQISE
jgi:hypothetical protein